MKRSSDHLDSLFSYAPLPGWMAGGKNQQIQGSEYVILKPTGGSFEGGHLDFELQNASHPIRFGGQTRFFIKGTFESKASADVTEWTPVPATEVANVVLAPNWLEMLIKNVEVFTPHSLIRCHNESQYIPAFLNTYLYSVMDPTLKSLLCPEACSTGNAVPSKKNGWQLEGADWTKYAPSVFTGDTISMQWTPLFLFPFYQSANYLHDPEGFSALPPPSLTGKINVKVSFRDDADCIFHKKAGNAKVYRFKLESFELCVEEARLSLAYEKSLSVPKQSNLNYFGVTKIMKEDTLQANLSTHKMKFEEVHLPESIFVFALPKKVNSGFWKYQEKAANTPIFLKNNIEKVSLTFDGKQMTLKVPNMSQIANPHMANKVE